MLINTNKLLHEMPEIKRQTAYKCKISQILNGRYIVQQGWEPNYLEIGELHVSRVNIMAALVSKEGNVLTIDDGTGKIEIRIFTDQQKIDSLNVGDVLLIVGRPREYKEKKYIVPEILRKIKDKKWIKYRTKELLLFSPKMSETQTSIQKESEFVKELPRPNHSIKIIEAIKKLDDGSGAETNKVIKECGVDKAEEYIEILLNEGEIFEIRAGKLKVLE